MSGIVQVKYAGGDWGEMSRLICLFLGVFLTTACGATDDIHLHYNGHNFSVPASPSVIASPGVKENMLILRYGSERGKRYIGFSDINADQSLRLGCASSDFFAAVFAGGDGSGCDVEQVTAFKKTFVKDRETGSWLTEEMTVYYSIGNDLSFLFVFDKENTAIKIDSDFLSKEKLKRVAVSAESE